MFPTIQFPGCTNIEKEKRGLGLASLNIYGAESSAPKVVAKMQIQLQTSENCLHISLNLRSGNNLE